MRIATLFYLLISISFHVVKAQHSYSKEFEVIGETTDSVLTMYIAIRLTSSSSRLEDYQFQFFNDTDDGKKVMLSYQDSTYLGTSGIKHFIRFEFPRSEIDQAFNLQMIHTTTAKEVVIKYDINELHPFILMDQAGLPILNYWANPQTLSVSKYPVICFYYSHEFRTGLPPMVTTDEPVAQTLMVDSTFRVDKAISLNKSGLYLFQSDSSSTTGFALRVEELYYPKFTRLQELSRPLKYITTKEERLKIDSIGNSKKRFDEFWMGVGQNQQRAVNIIKTFYGRVEYANRQFTTYKEGWKTDKGLIYVVMGEPDVIEKIGNKETWTYRKSRYLPSRTYQFFKTTTIFSPAHYVLIREKKHGNPWFEAIDLLRKGIFK